MFPQRPIETWERAQLNSDNFGEKIVVRRSFNSNQTVLDPEWIVNEMQLHKGERFALLTQVVLIIFRFFFIFRALELSFLNICLWTFLKMEKGKIKRWVSTHWWPARFLSSSESSALICTKVSLCFMLEVSQKLEHRCLAVWDRKAT